MSEPGTGAAPATTRRTGALVLVVLGAAALFAANTWPGWAALPFLTAETEQVLALFNVSVMLGIVVNLAEAVSDRPRLRHLGDVVTSAFGIALAWQVLVVFPFRFAAGGFDWAVLVRVLLVLGLVGSAIGVGAAVVRLVHDVAGRR